MEADAETHSQALGRVQEVLLGGRIVGGGIKDTHRQKQKRKQKPKNLTPKDSQRLNP